MKKLNLGCGRDIIEGWTNLDINPNVGADVIFDLEQIETIAKWPDGTNLLPFKDNHFDKILCSHTLEHLRNILPLMEELWRISKPKAEFIIRVPYALHNSAFDDPTHIRFFVPESFIYFAQTAYKRTDYGYGGDWQVKEVLLVISPLMRDRLRKQGFENKEGLNFAVKHLHNTADEIIAQLECIKPARPVTDPEEYPKLGIQVRPEEKKDGPTPKNT